MNVHSAQHWVNDGCELSYIPDMDRVRAEGITKIHASCTPPCPRVTAALEFLRDPESREADVDLGQPTTGRTFSI